MELGSEVAYTSLHPCNFGPQQPQTYPPGATTPCMHGPQLKNDNGIIEYPPMVELYVRPDPSGSHCVDCTACFDPDGNVRMSTYHRSGDGNATYDAPACPQYCLRNVDPQPRAENIRATHQLVVASEGLHEAPCDTITKYNDLESRLENTTICEGKEVKVVDAVPAHVEFGRLGGMHSKAFFVAPRTANYTFHTNFDDGGELWLSPHADPRAAVRVLRTEHATKVDTNHNTVSSCGEWKCLGERCFRAFNGYLDYNTAIKSCATYGALLAAPRTSAENTLIHELISSNSWIGIDDRGMVGHWKYSDGSRAGYALRGELHGWEYEVFNHGEPNDYNNAEKCGEM